MSKITQGLSKAILEQIKGYNRLAASITSLTVFIRPIKGKGDGI